MNALRRVSISSRVVVGGDLVMRALRRHSLGEGVVRPALSAIDLARVDLSRGEKAQNNMAAVSALGGTVRVSIRRLNS
jgi:hypothetical protein